MKNESSGTDYSAGNENNSSYPDPLAIINCVLNAPLMLTGIIGNSLVLVAILRTPSLRSPSTVFLCSLAVSDLLVGLIVQPVFIVRVLKFSPSLVDANKILPGLARGVSLCTMATISVDRFLALHCHMRYPDLVTTKRATYISATLWFVCVVFICIYFWRGTIYFPTISVGIAICLLTSSLCYLRIYRIVRLHQLQIQAQQQAVERFNAQHNLNLLRSKKSAINTFIYHICMILCYTPLFIYFLVPILSDEDWKTLWGFASTLLFLNSSINPFLYCWRLIALRVAVVKTLRKMLCKQTQET